MDPRPRQIQRMSHDTKVESRIHLTPEEKSIAHSLESIKALENEIEIAGVILVWRGLKNATVVNFKANYSDDDIKDTKETVQKAGLYFNTGFLPSGKMVAYVARSEEDLNTLVELMVKDHGDPSVYLKLGSLFGFPATAIEAYDKVNRAAKEVSTVSEEYEQIRKQHVLLEKERRELIPTHLSLFSQFVFSRSNWELELETSKKWAEEIRLVSPELYRLIQIKFAY